MLSIDRLFMIAAFVGGGLFAVQLILMFIGGGDVDADVDADFDVSGDAGVHDPTNVSFKVLSLQGITAFIMMFGLVGWAMRADSKAAPLPSLAAALAAGWVSTWVISKLFAFFNGLQSSGTFDMRKAIGTTAQVYLTVGPNKPGKVSIIVGNRSLTVDATTDGLQTLATGTSVMVTRVVSDTVVVVEKD